MVKPMTFGSDPNRQGRGGGKGGRGGGSNGGRGGGASGKKKKEDKRALLSVEGGQRMSKVEKERMRRYERGASNSSKGVKKPFLKREIKRSEKKIASATKRAAQAEVLLPTEPGRLEVDGPLERTDRVTQQQVAAEVDVQTQAKAYNMVLDKLGPYRVSYAADGRRLLLGGRKGHVAVVKWEGGQVAHEMQLRETVRDLCFLRDHTMYAVAQHKNLYIYDSAGTELHCLRTHRPQVNRLAYLRYHWLLATVGSSGVLRWLDVSTGENVTDYATKQATSRPRAAGRAPPHPSHRSQGDTDCMRVNPWNAVVHLGHHNGVVTLWTPNVRRRRQQQHHHSPASASASTITRPPGCDQVHEPVAKMLCHKGAVSALAVDRSGRYMATAGRDGTVKTWDVRRRQSNAHTYQRAHVPPPARTRTRSSLL
jgi:U3 small nucleolar RNA-associated protein 7